MNRMDKMVSFRLSAEEFELFKDHCSAINARSVSEMAREAVHHYMENQQADPDIDLRTKVLTLESKLESLESEVARVLSRVRRLGGPEEQHGG
jgi:predicted DNA-binding protein